MANTKLRIQLYAHGSEKVIFERFIDYDETFRFAQVREIRYAAKLFGHLNPGFVCSLTV